MREPVFARGAGGYGLSVNDSALVTGGLMVLFVAAMAVAMLLERRRVRRLTRDPSRVPADLRRQALSSQLRRRHPEEER